MAEINFRQATEDDSTTYANWVNELGWNVSEDYYNAFRAQHPENAFVAEQDGEMIGKDVILNFLASIRSANFTIAPDCFRLIVACSRPPGACVLLVVMLFPRFFISQT